MLCMHKNLLYMHVCTIHTFKHWFCVYVCVCRTFPRFARCARNRCNCVCVYGLNVARALPPTFRSCWCKCGSFPIPRRSLSSVCLSLLLVDAFGLFVDYGAFCYFVSDDVTVMYESSVVACHIKWLVGDCC